MRRLRSRLWAQQNGFKRPCFDDVVASYDLPDDIEGPNDLDDYRNNQTQAIAREDLK